MYDEKLFTVDANIASMVNPVSLSDVELKERQHLQEWILANPNILGKGVEIVTSEFDRWQTAEGDPVRDRLDILAIDPDGRIVVVELKRDYAPETVHMQAINYAAMVSRLTQNDVAQLYSAACQRKGVAIDTESALTKLTAERLMTAESIRRPRIILVASGFPPSVTSAVVWLNEQGVDMSLIRYRCFQLNNGQLVVAFSKLFPVPDVEEFTIGKSPDGGEPIEEPGVPWEEESLRRLAGQANDATLAVMDLCAEEGAAPITVQDIAQRANITQGAVSGQLAGLTRVLRNPAYHFDQKLWPFRYSPLANGLASYTMDSETARTWREIRQGTNPEASSDPLPATES